MTSKVNQSNINTKMTSDEFVLINSDSSDNFILFNALRDLCSNNIDYFKDDDTVGGQRLHGAFIGIIDHLDRLKPMIEEVNQFSHQYDFDETVKGNGYRSFIYVVNCCIDQTLKLIRYVTQHRGTILFRKNIYMREVEAYNHLLASLCTCFTALLTMHKWSFGDGELFSHGTHTAQELFDNIDIINQYCFYGRCLGFQFCESIRPVLKFISICMAGFSEAYYSDGGKISKATSSMFSSGKYYLDPELRARRIVNISQCASVDFCKSFWFLAESELMHTLPGIVGSKIKVNRVITIPPEPIQMHHIASNSVIDIPIPHSHIGTAPILARLLSFKRRHGMIGEGSNSPATVGSPTPPPNPAGSTEEIHPPSNALIIHCHGGGFVAQSSKSHEIYLREWAVDLNVPILSIDYSLAPQAPFPRALEEVFYAYCWAINNSHLLGTTAEKIIFAGDSAGANLNLGCALKCIDTGIRKPDGIFIAYCPVLVSFVPSPARLLSLMDPLLPFGFMMRCLKGYACPNEQVLEENRQKTEKLNEIKNAKINFNKSNNINFTTKSVTLVSVQSEDKENILEDRLSDTMDDNSLWENVQPSICDLQPQISHLSPISDTVSDTLAGASFKSHTGGGNTIEIISPDESNTITSLEEDSQPITLQRTITNISDNKTSTNDEIFTDCDLLTSDQNTFQDNPVNGVAANEDKNKYVSEFIERYVLDTTTDAEGHVRPILRPISRTPSEENVIFDIGKETISVQNIQEKIQKAAGNLVNAVSTTINQITTSKEISDSSSQNIEFKSNLDALIQRSPSDEFIFQVPKDPYLSPYFASDEALHQMPPTNILTVELDPCLDDCVTFAKRLKKLGKSVTLDILPGLPHGFLNFAMLSKEAHEGSKLCCKRIAELLDIVIEPDIQRRNCC